MLHYTKFKYCPRCAKEDLKVFEKNAFKCGSCGFVYFHNMASAVAAIIECDHSVVLTRRSSEPGRGKFDLPGGFVDYHESLERALVREIAEEIGAEVANPAYLGSWPNTYHYKDITYFTCDSVFVCRLTVAALPQFKANHEIAGIEIVNPLELDLNLFAFDSSRKAFEYYLSLRQK